MDRIENLASLLKEEVARYAKAEAWRGDLFFFEASDKPVYSVIFAPHEDHPDKLPSVVIMAQVIGDNVIINEDGTDRPLFKRLMEQGLSRQQIILAYAKESLPT
jgi:hypothetical protein